MSEAKGSADALPAGFTGAAEGKLPKAPMLGAGYAGGACLVGAFIEGNVISSSLPAQPVLLICGFYEAAAAEAGAGFAAG